SNLEYLNVFSTVVDWKNIYNIPSLKTLKLRNRVKFDTNINILKYIKNIEFVWEDECDEIFSKDWGLESIAITKYPHKNIDFLGNQQSLKKLCLIDSFNLKNLQGIQYLH